MQIILLVGAKLARVVQVLAHDIDVERMGPCIGAHLRPRDSLFWFARPRLMLNLMHFTLFTVRAASRSYKLFTVVLKAGPWPLPFVPACRTSFCLTRVGCWLTMYAMCLAQSPDWRRCQRLFEKPVL